MASSSLIPCASSFLLRKRFQVLHIEPDVIERPPLRGNQARLPLRERKIRPRNVVAVDHPGEDWRCRCPARRQKFSRTRPASRECPRDRNECDSSPRRSEVTGRQRTPREFRRPVHVTLVRISGLLDLDAVRFPFGKPRGHIFPGKAKVIHDGARRRPSRIRLPQHDVNPGNWISISGPFCTTVPPIVAVQMFLRLHIFHEQMDVPHPDARVIGRRSCALAGNTANAAAIRTSKHRIFMAVFFMRFSVSCSAMARTIHPIRILQNQLPM